VESWCKANASNVAVARDVSDDRRYAGCDSENAVTVDTLAPYLTFFTNHLYAVAFFAALIDSLGVPFPGRFLLITAGAVSAGGPDATWTVMFAAAGHVVGDHVLYLIGWVGGDRILSLYCRWTLGSAHCVRKAERYFERWGGATIVIGRFVASVRLFAVTLAGSGGIRYPKFLALDILGALTGAATFVLLGYFFGAQASRIVERYGDVALVIAGLFALAAGSFIAYRLWKRRRHGPAAMKRRHPA
jgi:membrane protein DedA with SNARE-associated domain